MTPNLRAFPYPYKAALSICSDIDHTDTWEQFEKIHFFLSEEIGLKYSTCFFPFDDKQRFSFYSKRDLDKSVIIKYIQLGIIDAIHSYGEKADFKRKDAEATLTELVRNDCHLDVWIDHANSISNLSKFRMSGRGDLPGSAEYHFDLTKNYGIKFIWTERLTNIVGQGVPLSLSQFKCIYSRKQPFHSMLNMLKTIIKIILNLLNSKKYDYFVKNELVKISKLKDDEKVFEFIRFYNQNNKSLEGDSFEDLHFSINSRVLQFLKEVGGYSIVYTHLGKNFNLKTEEGNKTMQALKELKKESESGNIYIESTSKLLNYYILTKYLNWSYEIIDGIHNIYIKKIDDPVFGEYYPKLSELKDITFYVPGDARLFIRDREIKSIRKNSKDHKGQESVTIL